MRRYSAFDDFPDSGWTTPVWTFGAGNAAGKLEPLSKKSGRQCGPCVNAAEPMFSYPQVCRSMKETVAHGTVTEAGYLVVTPAATSASAHHFGVIRFTAPEAGTYRVQVELKTSDLGYGGTMCRIYLTRGDVMMPLTECNVAKSFGHHREIEQVVKLEKGTAISLAIGPSPHGDNASDSTLARMEVEQVNPAWHDSPALLAGAPLLLAVLVYGLWRRRAQRP